MNLLKFITLGSVDDGKSTLIGRLLHDSHAILTDQWATIQAQSQNKRGEEVDFSLFTDGLRAERAQGITIDIAYKYFSTPKRKFIIADAPGHFEYTRNMITGASHSEVAIILIDARKGVSAQTRRHSLIVSLLRFSTIIVAINKMDMVDYEQTTFQKIVTEYAEMAKDLGFSAIYYLPISALKGDNIVALSAKVPWFQDLPLLPLLESIELEEEENRTDARFFVQYIIENESFNYYAGTVISGIYKKGDAITILPSGEQSVIESIAIGGREYEQATINQAITIRLEDNIAVKRGDMIALNDNLPKKSHQVEILLCWMHYDALELGKEYILQIHSQEVKIIVQTLLYQLNIHTFEKEFSPQSVQLNDITKVEIVTKSPLIYDPYPSLSACGRGILIDVETCATVAACWLETYLF